MQELKVKENLHFVIVDLKAGKDTKEILAKLNHCYPFADDDIQENVQKYLGPNNREIIKESIESLQDGDAENLGSLMSKAQEAFDKYLQPACSSQLTALVLHKVLQFEPIQIDSNFCKS